MANQNQLQYENFENQLQTQENQSRIGVCKHCGATLDEDLLFCPECGERIGGGERLCPVCKTSTTSEFCPNCGSRVIPLQCPNCGHESLSDFCDNCGTLLNNELQQFFEQSEQKVQQLSQQEAEQIREEINQSLTPEIQEYIEKVKEKKILLEEREYFNKREKRIVSVFGKSPFEFSEQDPEEQKIIMKCYEGLKEKLTEDREKKENETNLQEKKELENEQKRKEMYAKYDDLVQEVEQDVQCAKNLESERKRREEEERRRIEAERKRREEEERRRIEAERKRREEEERRRAEEERKQRAFEDRILGKFVFYGDEYEMWLKIDSKTSASSYDVCHVCGNTICCKYDVEYDLHTFKLKNPRVMGSRDSCGYLHAVSGTNFIGWFNYDGSILNGSWRVASITYTKVSY